MGWIIVRLSRAWHYYANSVCFDEVGTNLRKRSPWAREHLDDLEDDEKEAMEVQTRKHWTK